MFLGFSVQENSLSVHSNFYEAPFQVNRVAQTDIGDYIDIDTSFIRKDISTIYHSLRRTLL
jgi:hypothetical protein